MLRYLILVSLAGALAACGTVPNTPIVTKSGTTFEAHQRDLADCHRSTATTVTFGNRITKCMSAKGYTILEGF